MAWLARILIFLGIAIGGAVSCIWTYFVETFVDAFKFSFKERKRETSEWINDNL